MNLEKRLLILLVKILKKMIKVQTLNFQASEPVVILGFGQMAQVLANFLGTPLASGVNSDAGWPYVAFDIDLSVLKSSRTLGFPVLYGDGSRPAVLQSAGISSPKAVMVMYTGREKTIGSVQRLRLAFPGIPIYARAQDLSHLLELKKAGATDAILENAETSLQLGSKLLKGLGVMSDDVTFLSQLVRDSMELQAQDAFDRTGDQGIEVMKPFQVRVSDLIGDLPPSTPYESSNVNKMVNKLVSATLDQSLDDGKHNEPDSVGKGVLFCELESENKSPISNGDVKGGEVRKDPSRPFVNASEES